MSPLSLEIISLSAALRAAVPYKVAPVAIALIPPSDTYPTQLPPPCDKYALT